ncbi:hypothetical protein ACNAN0_07390 [Agrilactobacillus fermenti]
MRFDQMPVTIEIGGLATQTDGSVLIRYGDTVVLSTVINGEETGQGEALSLEVQYRLSSLVTPELGVDAAVNEIQPKLAAHRIKQILEPLLPKKANQDIQITNTVLSYDADCAPFLAALLGSALALGISDIPFLGPIASVAVAQLDDNTVILNPTSIQRQQAEMYALVAGTDQGLSFVNATGKSMSEKTLSQGLMFALDEIRRINKFQAKIIATIGKSKLEFKKTAIADTLKSEIFKLYRKQMLATLTTTNSATRAAKIKTIKTSALNYFKTSMRVETNTQALVLKYLAELEQAMTRQLLLDKNIRVAGRALDALRPLSVQLNMLSTATGSSLLQQGKTQILAALRSAKIKSNDVKAAIQINTHFLPIRGESNDDFQVTQQIDWLDHQYIRNALTQVWLPQADHLQRLNLDLEILDRDGSILSASTNAAMLALLATGALVDSAVVSVTMGLVQHQGKIVVLTDISNLEQRFSESRLEIAGTKQALTAFQMIGQPIVMAQPELTKVIMQARQAQLALLELVKQAISI